MKNAAAFVLLAVLTSIPANAYDIRATWQLYDTETNSVIRTLSDGQRIDLHTVANRNSLAVVASFTYKRSGDGLADHTAWVSWTLTHSARPNQHTQRTDQEDAAGGWWPVCGVHRWRGQPMLRSEHRGHVHHRGRGLVFRRTNHRAAGVRLDHDCASWTPSRSSVHRPGRPVPCATVIPKPARH